MATRSIVSHQFSRSLAGGALLLGLLISAVATAQNTNDYSLSLRGKCRQHLRRQSINNFDEFTPTPTPPNSRCTLAIKAFNKRSRHGVQDVWFIATWIRKISRPGGLLGKRVVFARAKTDKQGKAKIRFKWPKQTTCWLLVASARPEYSESINGLHHALNGPANECDCAGNNCT